jgi:hypothetical protein
MNVGELKQKLDDFGDHVLVGVIKDWGGDDERHWLIADVDDGTTEDEDGDPVTAVIVHVEGRGRS